ncbi:MAG: 3-keto-5-aminohexanoate cleavage protein, partial [Desulfatiglandales bacterium]|nr:3-keto-5-aminohexanoate cleavage protein [Desulfatiglandales bacterium]
YSHRSDSAPHHYHGYDFGGCVRVGLGGNIYYRKGELATNAQLVARTARIARELGKEPATPYGARQILGLRPLKREGRKDMDNPIPLQRDFYVSEKRSHNTNPFS